MIHSIQESITILLQPEQLIVDDNRVAVVVKNIGKVVCRGLTIRVRPVRNLFLASDGVLSFGTLHPQQSTEDSITLSAARAGTARLCLQCYWSLPERSYNESLNFDITVIEAVAPKIAKSPPKKSTRPYNLRKVRQLLNEIFDLDELRDFVFDEPDFRPVHDALTDNDRRPEILRRVVEFADRRGLIPQLLAWAQQANPARYTEGEPYEQ